MRRCPFQRRPAVAELSDAEREVAELAAAGATAREVGKMLRKSPETVRRQLRSIYGKLGVTSRAELATTLADDQSAACP